MMSRPSLFSLVITLIVFWTPFLVHAQGIAEGRSVVVAGHSFHAPSGRVLNSLATHVGAGRVETILAGGPAGTIGALWINPLRRSKILKAIDENNAAALILASTGGRGNEANAIRRWVSAAMKVQADITIVLNIAHPARGGQTDVTRFESKLDASLSGALAMAAEIERDIPGARIEVFTGGYAALVAKELEESDALSVTQKVFRDRIGHGTPLVYTAQGLTWAIPLYGIDDPMEYYHSSEGLDANDLMMIIDGVVQRTGMVR